MRYRIILILAFVLTALDQISKWFVEQHIPLYKQITVTGFFNLVNVRNYGAAFGFLNDPSSSWQIWLFLGATVLASVVIFIVAKGAEAKDTPLFFALGCILGGAAGNLIDRIRLGSVVDFLDIHLAGWHWPAFNVADIAICVGAGLTALLMFRSAGPKSGDGHPS